MKMALPLDLFQEGYDLLSAYGGEPFEEVGNRLARFQIVNQGLDGNAGAPEDGASSHDFWIRTDDA